MREAGAGAPRSDTGRRALSVACRVAHLVAMAILAGGEFFGAPPASLGAWLVATAATGLALLVLEASHSRHWIHQVRGVLALGHAAIAALAHVAGSTATILALVVGALGSHLPRAVRWWSVRYRRVV